MDSRSDHSTGLYAKLGHTRCIQSRIVAKVVTAWSAAEAHRLGVSDEVDELTVQRNAALAELRQAGADMERFREAARREAQLAAQIRQLRRQRGES